MAQQMALTTVERTESRLALMTQRSQTATRLRTNLSTRSRRSKTEFAFFARLSSETHESATKSRPKKQNAGPIGARKKRVERA